LFCDLSSSGFFKEQLHPNEDITTCPNIESDPIIEKFEDQSVVKQVLSSMNNSVEPTNAIHHIFIDGTCKVEVMSLEDKWTCFRSTTIASKVSLVKQLVYFVFQMALHTAAETDAYLNQVSEKISLALKPW
jgi:hypothetical protein